MENKTINKKDPKEEKIKKLQKETTINNNLANLEKDVLSIETQLKANSVSIDDNQELVDICNEYIPHIEGLRKKIAQYLTK